MVRWTTTAVLVVAGFLAGCDDTVFDRDEALIEVLRADLTALRARVEQLEAKLAGVSVSGDDFIFTGVNVHVRNDSGSTDGALDGLGNLIVGYNEGTLSQVRSGSHNLVVGREHEYTSYGGFVAGLQNTVTGAYASVSGGVNSVASGDGASVSGGVINTASGNRASVSGGLGNIATGAYASVSGGQGNAASAWYASVSGGGSNTASGLLASVSGGRNNDAAHVCSHICGGGSFAVGHTTTADYENYP
jgi:hypothetical protein